MQGHEPSVTDASNPKKQLYWKYSATVALILIFLKHSKHFYRDFPQSLWFIPSVIYPLRTVADR